MKIRLVDGIPATAAPIAASDDGGEYYIEKDGSISYRHAWSPTLWAGPTRASFESAAAAWNAYQTNVVEVLGDEDSELGEVAKLEGELRRLSLLERKDSLWRMLLQQAHEGQL